MRQAVLAPVSETYSQIKAKKYETLIIQIWNVLPIFCRFTSPKLAAGFSSLLEYLEPMVNRDTHGLRILALKVFTEIINHCRTTNQVTDQVKQTRLGLQRISLAYVEGLSKLYLTSKLADSDRSQTLHAIQEFASISKAVTLSNKFLLSFAELVAAKEASTTDADNVMLQLDILIALMEKVKLKEDNYVQVMRGVKVFVDDRATQKKGYKILTKVVERFDLESFDQLVEIKQEITPMMKGQATKQRLQLIHSFVKAIVKFKDTQDSQILPKVTQLVQSMVLELITALNNSNLKTRKLAEEVFKSISAVLSHFNAVPQLFQLLLVGLAGTSPQMQSSTIRALIFNLKLNLTLAIYTSVEDTTGKQLKVNKLLSGTDTV